jgi:hypothetical protein
MEMALGRRDRAMTLSAMERAILLSWLVDGLNEGYERLMADGCPPYENDIPKFTEARDRAMREAFSAPGVMQQLHEYAGVEISASQAEIYRARTQDYGNIER